MSELGVGDERFEAMSPEEEKAIVTENEKGFKKHKAQNSVDITNSLPIVVIKNYTANFGSPTKEALLEALAQWAAKLIENQVNKYNRQPIAINILYSQQIAHIIVLSDNRENAKILAKGAIVIHECITNLKKFDHCLLLALPTKPINFVSLSDADPESSLSFVMQKLLDIGIDSGISVQQMAYMERLGGRASDLESVSCWIIHFISLLTSL